MTRLYLNMHTGKFQKSPTSKVPANPEIASERGRSMASLNKARKLAEQHGIEIEKDTQGGWWVTCDKFTPENDPMDGSHFCGNGREVLEAVESYVTALSA